MNFPEFFHHELTPWPYIHLLLVLIFMGVQLIWASLVMQLVKNLPAMQDTWV